jgi:hypothetical protein
MKKILVSCFSLLAACFGGMSTAEANAGWPKQWCEAQPGMTKGQIIELMGAPTQTTATNLIWTDNHYRFYAFMEADGTARQLDINMVDLSDAEKKALQCGDVRTRRSMLAAAKAQSKPQLEQTPACTLISDAQMSGIIGAPLHGTASGRSKCIYKPATGSVPYVEFSMDYGDGEAGMKGAGFAEGHQRGLTSPYDGVGDQAVAAGPALFIRTGDDLITLVFTGVPDVRTKAKKIVDTAKGSPGGS